MQSAVVAKPVADFGCVQGGWSHLVEDRVHGTSFLGAVSLTEGELL